MNIKVKAVSFNADQKLIDFINKKVAKLDTLFEGIISLEVTLKVEKPESVKNKVAEIKVSIPVNDYLFAKKQADSFEEATDLAVDAIKRQLEKYKNKLKNK